VLTDRSSLEQAFLRHSHLPYLLSDKWKIKIWWWAVFHKTIDLDHPIGFGEKLQWLKLHNRKTEYHKWVDKSLVKDYVASQIGEEYTIPTIGVYDNWKDFVTALPTFPEQFVVKTTHGCGGSGVVVCKDKATFNLRAANRQLKRSILKDDYKLHAEWPYKDLTKRFIVEQYLEDASGELRDYKFFCFNGKVKCFKIDFGRMVEHHANYYTPDGDLLPYGEVAYTPNPNAKVDMPKNREKMITLAETLAQEQPFLRVDFYEVNGKVYFGEITFYPASGLSHWTTEDADGILGSWIDLSTTKNRINIYG